MGSPIFLDFQATTPLDARVLDAMMPWFAAPANPHSAQHEAGIAALRAVDEARAQIADVAGARGDGVLFTPGATFASNLVIRSFAGPDEKIVISAIEHPCVLETARWCAGQGAKLEIIPVDSEGLIDLDAAYELIEGASLVSVMAVNNEVGTIQPIGEVADYCRAHDIPFHSDAAQALGRIALSDLDENVILTLSSHKAYGPQGIGAICTSAPMLGRLRPLVTGGGQQEGLHPGTLPTALCVGFGKACEIALGERDQDWTRAAALAAQFLARLRQRGVGFALNGSDEARIPHNLNLSFEEIDGDELLALLPEVALATGSACSSGAIGRSKVLEAMGLPPERLAGAVRIGFGRTSQIPEIDEAADRIAAAVERLREGS